MTSVSIILSHYKSVNFLHAAISQIRKYKHPEIEQRIYIVDQSDEVTFNGLANTYAKDPDMWVIHTRPLYSGYGLDFLFHNDLIKTDFVCQMHVDCIAIDDRFLYLPIKLIEENNYSFVGQLQFIADGKASIYPPNKFFAMAQCFNVARTATYREMSLHAGFTRFHNRPDCGLTFLNDDWGKWAAEDYQARGSDDDVVAFCWEDRHRQHDKLGLAVTGFIEPSWGRIIDELVFHFCSANESKGVMSSMSPMYRKYLGRINDGYTEDLIDEMVSLAKANQPPQTEILRRNYWNGKTKMSSPPSDELNKRIEELKKV